MRLMIIKHNFAKAYGWTPRQVENEVDTVEYDILMDLMNIDIKEENRRMKDELNKHGRA